MAKNKRKTTKPRSHVERLGPSQRGVELLQRRQREWLRTLQQSPPESFPREIAEREKRLLELFASYNALHVITNIYFANIVHDAERYVESEHEGSASVVELAAALLLARPAPDAPHSGPPRPIGADLLEPAQTLLRELLMLESFRVKYALANLGESVAGSVRARAFSRYLFTRGTSFAWQEAEILQLIGGDPATSEILQATVGFTVEDALAVVAAVERLTEERFDIKRERIASMVAPTMSGELPEGFERLSDHLPLDPKQRRRFVTSWIIAWAFHNLGDDLALSPAEVGVAAGISNEASMGVLQALATGWGVDGSLFERFEHVRRRPYLRAGSGLYVCTYPGSDLWALRGLIERNIADAGGKHFERWQRRRAAAVENRAKELLTQALAPDETHRGLEYVSADSRGEIDVLLRRDDVLLVVETKAGGLTPSGHRGGDRLITRLDDLLRKAAEQAASARAAVLGGAVQLTRRSDHQAVTLDGERIREVHPIVVTLEDLSVVAPVLWQLAGTRLLPGGVETPWVVSLTELEVISDLIEYPAQLVHFLRRRARLNQIGGRIASDELDWFMHYLSRNLYFEHDDPDLFQQFPSLTDPIDAYYLHRKGLRTRPAPKPQQNLSHDMRKMLQYLETQRPNGHVAAACMLLDLSPDARKQVLKDLDRLARRARRRDAVQRGVYVAGARDGTTLVTVVVVPQGCEDRLLDCMDVHLRDQLELHHADRALSLGTAVGGTALIDALLVVEPGVWELPTPKGEATS